MALYRKRPVTVEAIRYTGTQESLIELYDFLGGDQNPMWIEQDPLVVKIDTLEGWMLVEPGSYVIRGVKGEYYPCRYDIFVLTYEQVTWDE